MLFKNKKKEELRVDESLSHIAFIMDGNGRWAKARALPRRMGHRQGAIAFEKIVRECSKIGIKTVTVYAFSTENWKRPKEEIDAIMELLSNYIDRAEDEKGTRYVFLGDKSVLNEDLRIRMEKLERESVDREYTLNIAFNYGGRAELVTAFNELASLGKTSITENDISEHLYTRDSKDPDLIVRTANECRISNFLLWQCAYSEFYFTDVLWPDFDERELHKAVKSFYKRKRNFGGI
ncbi:MAG: di-trans,poly-cis-decaprenylcistransferase [Ruminococcaceae bacterium]|nr:di-trans,poly-cis-decaprenylcistransferase [Oscillospiraceae bacterium]